MQTSITRTGSLAAWAGTADDLQRLLRHVESALDEQRRAALREVEARKAQWLARGMSEASAEAEAVRERKRRHEEFTERVTSTDARSEVQRTGTLTEVLSAISAKELRDLSVTYPRYASSQRRRVAFFFSRSGLHIRVDADEPVWADSMLRSTLAEAQRRCPSWAFVFTAWGAPLLALVVHVSLVLCTFATTRKLLDVSGLTGVLIGSAVALPVTVIISDARVLQRILPRFEVLPEGTRAAGTARALALGGVMISTLLGALASLLDERLALTRHGRGRGRRAASRAAGAPLT